MFKPKLPYDCSKLVLDHTNIVDIEATLVALSVTGDDATRLRKDRKNPMILFRKLVGDPLSLMRCMRDNNVILSGSRAANYFFPGSCRDSSDWDFFCAIVDPDSDTGSAGPFMSHMESMGVKWDSGYNRTEGTYGDLYVDVIRGTKARVGGGTSKIQLMCAKGSDVLSCLLRFHSTAPQCFLSGVAAAHMYAPLSARGEFIVWKGNSRHDRSEQLDLAVLTCVPHNSSLFRNCPPNRKDFLYAEIGRLRHEAQVKMDGEGEQGKEDVRKQILALSASKPLWAVPDIADTIFEPCTCKPQDSTSKAIEKYKSRGYREVGFARDASEAEELVEGSSRKRRYLRKLGDKYSCIVQFDTYFDQENESRRVQDLASRLESFEWVEDSLGTSVYSQTNPGTN